MLIGPVFNRQVVLAPRRTRIYIARAAYVFALFLLMITAWLVFSGRGVIHFQRGMKWRPDWATIRSLFRFGLPTMVLTLALAHVYVVLRYY